MLVLLRLCSPSLSSTETFQLDAVEVWQLVPPEDDAAAATSTKGEHSSRNWAESTWLSCGDFDASLQSVKQSGSWCCSTSHVQHMSTVAEHNQSCPVPLFVLPHCCCCSGGSVLDKAKEDQKILQWAGVGSNYSAALKDEPIED